MQFSKETTLLFSLKSGENFAQNIANRIGIPLGNLEERNFEDGEFKIRPMESVRGMHCIVIQSLYNDEEFSVSDKLVRLLFLIGALKESARNVSVIIPYLCFARKDRKTQPRDPVTTRYIAQLLEAMNISHIVTIDVHNLQAYQNSFRCKTDHLEANELFVSFLLKHYKNEDIVIMSPDAGGMKRADRVRELTSEKTNKNIPLIFMEKKRSEGVISGNTIVGDVQNKTVVIIDDLISSGGTLSRAANACKESGAKSILAMATHGVFNSQTYKNLSNENLTKIIITNTLSLFPESMDTIKDKIEVLDTTSLIASFIQDKLCSQYSRLP